jgi:U6 snRNA-associated Sm-like protein LSm1
VIRGENVVFLGELNREKHAKMLESLQRIEPQDAYSLCKLELEHRKEQDRIKYKELRKKGFSTDFTEYDTY